MPIPEALAAAYDPEQFRRDGHALIDALADYLGRAGARELPVLPCADPTALTQEYARDFVTPEPAELSALAAAALNTAASSSSRRTSPDSRPARR